MIVRDMRLPSYLMVDFAYPICLFLFKNWKAPNDVKKKRFDNGMNSNRVAIGNAFGAL